jgi:capsule polysaccharide export protein KpsE/RkpR
MYSTSKPDQTKATPTMLPTTQSISKKTKNRTFGTLGTLINVVVMCVLVLLSFSQIYISTSMIANVPESQSVPNIDTTPSTTVSLAANAASMVSATTDTNSMIPNLEDASPRYVVFSTYKCGLTNCTPSRLAAERNSRKQWQRISGAKFVDFSDSESTM